MVRAPILFLHIPKAGGSTLRSLLHQQYPASQIYKIESDITGDILRFAELAPEQLNQIRLVTGHMAFGLHAKLKQAKYLTLLREPVKRVVSEYRFIASNPHHVLHAAVSQLSLLDYLDSGLSGQISNGQTRLISGIWEEGQCGVPGGREVTEADYQTALANLDRYFISPGVLDYYDETLITWQQALSWRWPFYLRENVTPGRSKPLSDAETEAMIALNQWDIKLYESVRVHQEAELASRPAGFHARVHLFKTLNRAYPKWLALRHRFVALLAN